LRRAVKSDPVPGELAIRHGHVKVTCGKSFYTVDLNQPFFEKISSPWLYFQTFLSYTFTTVVHQPFEYPEEKYRHIAPMVS
jgi:hypothetical protein